MSYIVVSDSSSNILEENEHYKTVPMHILLGEEDWADTKDRDPMEFNRKLEAFQGHTSTACPSPEEWMGAFGDADEVYCFTISHNLSGSFNSAIAAKAMYEEQYPDRHVYIADSLATGPRMVMMMDRFRELYAEGIRGDEMMEKIEEYRSNTELMFTLQSIKRLADNGRVSPLLVKAIGILDLRLIGIASAEGTVAILDKHRGAAKVLKGTYKQMLKHGYNGGKIVISHNQNEADAKALVEMARAQFGESVQAEIHSTTALCSFYAEKYGYIIGFEVDKSHKHHGLFG